MSTYAEGLLAAAKVCESMVVGGRAWTAEQQITAGALLTAAEVLRSLAAGIRPGENDAKRPEQRLLLEEVARVASSTSIPTYAAAERLEPRLITDHHDGHGLAESIRIEADALGPGGASHRYTVTADDHHVAGIQYQRGPRNEPGSTPGVLDSVLLAIVADRMRCFNEGPYRARENALVLTKTEEALHWLKHRADERARRGVLGKNQA